jgi:hypothetical protein
MAKPLNELNVVLQISPNNVALANLDLPSFQTKKAVHFSDTIKELSQWY